MFARKDSRIVRRPLMQQRLERVNRQVLTATVDSLRSKASAYNQRIRNGEEDGLEINLNIFSRVQGMIDARKLHTEKDVQDAVRHMLGWGL